MKHGSLFSGIGGFDLAAHWMGWENLFHCEMNPFGRKVLSYYWPKAKSYEDITKTDFSIWRGKIDIITGGFPCQPYSVAGKRKGKEDERHLWPEMLRSIKEIAPSWVVGENVHGLISWDGGLVFDEVQSDLEALGYDVFAYVLPAASVNAPHKRDRVWFVAHANNRGTSGKKRVQERDEIRKSFKSNHLWEFSSKSCSKRRGQRNHNWEKRQIQNYQDRNAEKNKSKRHGVERWTSEVGNFRFSSNTKSKSRRGELFEQSRKGKFRRQNRGAYANANLKGLQGRKEKGEFRESRKKQNEFASRFPRTDWKEFPTQPPICNGNDGIPSRLDGITFPKWRNESIKAGGNAIVPQVALNIFKAIEAYESSIHSAPNKR